MDNQRLLEILKHEIIPAMGCTEPAAAALAGAKARELLDGEPVEHVKIRASRDMVKNAMGVGLPGCSLKGISAAVALGVAGGDTSRKLSILSDVSPQRAELASHLKTDLEMVRNVPSLYVCVSVTSSRGREVSVTIAGEHDAFSKIVVDHEVILNEGARCYRQRDKSYSLDNLSISDILHFADTVPIEELGLLKTAIDTNMAIASYAMTHPCGLQVGKTMAEGIVEPPQTLDDAYRLAAAYAASGSDARMSGCPMPVYINSGSGNQGMTVTIPIQIVGSYLGVGPDKILRAVCVSELVGLMLTEKKSRLSALCGAFTASIGTACAYAYLLGGNNQMMNEVVNTMVADLTGIICDGAKNTCALKIYSCIQAAALAVKLSLAGHSPDEECGIVGSNSNESISHLSIISKQGMEETDQAIYSIMIDKVNHTPDC